MKQYLAVIQNSSFKIQEMGLKKWLRTLATLSEALGSIYSPHWAAHNYP